MRGRKCTLWISRSWSVATSTLPFITWLTARFAQKYNSPWLVRSGDKEVHNQLSVGGGGIIWEKWGTDGTWSRDIYPYFIPFLKIISVPLSYIPLHLPLTAPCERVILSSSNFFVLVLSLSGVAQTQQHILHGLWRTSQNHLLHAISSYLPIAKSANTNCGESWVYLSTNGREMDFAGGWTGQGLRYLQVRVRGTWRSRGPKI